MDGLIHIYEGDGKGKTSAAVGLAVRCAGSGQSVLFVQFLKDGSSSECKALSQIEGIELRACKESFGFVFRMDEKEKKRAARAYGDFYLEVIGQVAEGSYRLLVMDEILDACNLGMVDQESLLAFLKEKPKELEVVLTGRNPDERLTELADYVSYVRKKKHPFDRGIAARVGIEQ